MQSVRKSTFIGLQWRRLKIIVILKKILTDVTRNIFNKQSCLFWLALPQLFACPQQLQGARAIGSTAVFHFRHIIQSSCNLQFSLVRNKSQRLLYVLHWKDIGILSYLNFENNFQCLLKNLERTFGIEFSLKTSASRSPRCPAVHVSINWCLLALLLLWYRLRRFYNWLSLYFLRK